MKVIISKKEEIMPMQLENILQIDLCNMGEKEYEQDWNFITFLSRKNNEYNKIAIKLEDIQQLTILESDIQREDKSDSFDCGYHDYAKEEYKKRVAKTDCRLIYAIKKLEENGFDCIVKNESTGHIHSRSKNGYLMQFWCGTGKILGKSVRGIDNFIKCLKDN